VNARCPPSSDDLFTQLDGDTPLGSDRPREVDTFVTDDVEALRAHVRAFGGEIVDEIAPR
jgi:hypothetical protein